MILICVQYIYNFYASFVCSTRNHFWHHQKNEKKQITEFWCYRMTNNYTDKICLTYNTFQKILYTVREASHVIFSDHQKIKSWRYSLENKIRKFSKTNAKQEPKKKLVVPKKTPRTKKKSCFCRYQILIQTVPKKNPLPFWILLLNCTIFEKSLSQISRRGRRPTGGASDGGLSYYYARGATVVSH
jgi:hypothetical protein